MTVTTRITTPFGRETTAQDVLQEVDLTGKRAVVTGGASGVGRETARVLAAAGAEVTLAVRNIEAGESVAAEIIAGTGNAGVAVAPLDLARPSSVAAFTSAWQGPLHILVNNAGVMAVPELRRTAEGWEYQFATNHLGHFGLALGLHSALAAAGAARIVSVSSNGHVHGSIDFDDINFEHRAYDPWAAYSQSKVANVLFAVEATMRWAGDGITANALHPGGIHTNLQRHVDGPDVTPEVRETMDTYPWRTVEQGAATSVLLAASPLVEGVGGRYFEDCNEALPYAPSRAAENPDTFGVSSYALDPDVAGRLWDVSRKMLAG